MKQRLQFRCWSCERVFSLLVELYEYPERLSQCPYCGKELMIKLNPFPPPPSPTFRNGNGNGHSDPQGGAAFPEVMTTYPIKPE